MGEANPLQSVREGTPSCVHHWVLDDPDVGVVSGRCKRCGGERVFSARPDGLDRFDDDGEPRKSADGDAADRTG